MAVTETFLRTFRNFSRSDRQAFINENIDLASSHIVAQHVEAYLFDILEEMDDPEYVAQFLRDKGYEVKKNVSTTANNCA